MSTLQHLQGFTGSGGAALLPSRPALTINGQLANDFGAIANMGWSSQNSSNVWLEQVSVSAHCDHFLVFCRELEAAQVSFK